MIIYVYGHGRHINKKRIAIIEIENRKELSQGNLEARTKKLEATPPTIMFVLYYSA